MCYSVLWVFGAVIHRRLGVGSESYTGKGSFCSCQNLDNLEPLITHTLCDRSPCKAKLFKETASEQFLCACIWAQANTCSTRMHSQTAINSTFDNNDQVRWFTFRMRSEREEISLNQNRKTWEKGRREKDPCYHLTLLLEMAAFLLCSCRPRLAMAPTVQYDGETEAYWLTLGNGCLCVDFG